MAAVLSSESCVNSIDEIYVILTHETTYCKVMREILRP